MKWNESVASSCRYGEIAGAIWGRWEVLWEDSEADYQGHATILVNKGRKYAFYEWWYGSCSGCDGWEADGKDDAAIEKEMRDSALWFNSKKELRNWLTMLEGGKGLPANYNMERGGGLAAGIDILSGGLRGRINAVRKVFDIKPLPE